ncbi:MAG: hydrolase, HAD-superfamily, subfamily [Solirubrobacterales bacterium]|nr:hydrolase, HAD-superfamily, subfamily [Solirubrobacterales bacterium]
MSFDLVIPTVGRPSLERLLGALATQASGPEPARVIVVDDSRGHLRSALAALRAGSVSRRSAAVEVVVSPGRGPAAARNAGWRACDADWVAFLDDDVIPSGDWYRALAHDLQALPADAAGSQGRVCVPLPSARPPTDWERNVAGLEDALWATADMAYRRSVLLALGGFDERFCNAYREDCDFGLRVTSLGLRIVRGEREVSHPPGAAPFWKSVALQRGNADDALMRRLHGRDWRKRGGAPRGRLPYHLLCAAGASAGIVSALASRPRRATFAGLLPALGIAELAHSRIARGPRDRAEVARMLATSLVLPFAAVAHRMRGELRWRGDDLRRRRDKLRGPADPHARATLATKDDRPLAVLFDRDGTLIRDVPYNGDPALVSPMPAAREALDALRSAGVPFGVISNQSGVARGLISEEQVQAVNRRVEELLGPIGVWVHCPHGPGDLCECRKPAPGMVLRAAEQLGVPPSRCAVIGDIGSDIGAAAVAGARGVLVPTSATRRNEVTAAAVSAPDLLTAVDRLGVQL